MFNSHPQKCCSYEGIGNLKYQANSGSSVTSFQVRVLALYHVKGKQIQAQASITYSTALLFIIENQQERKSSFLKLNKQQAYILLISHFFLIDMKAHVE